MYTSLKWSTFQWPLFGQALTANIQQGQKFLLESNTLAYFVRATAMKQKSIKILRLGQSSDFRTFLNYFELMEKVLNRILNSKQLRNFRKSND